MQQDWSFLVLAFWLLALTTTVTGSFTVSVRSTACSLYDAYEQSTYHFGAARKVQRSPKLAAANRSDREEPELDSERSRHSYLNFTSSAEATMLLRRSSSIPAHKRDIPASTDSAVTVVGVTHTSPDLTVSRNLAPMSANSKLVPEVSLSKGQFVKRTLVTKALHFRHKRRYHSFANDPAQNSILHNARKPMGRDRTLLELGSLDLPASSRQKERIAKLNANLLKIAGMLRRKSTTINSMMNSQQLPDAPSTVMTQSTHQNAMKAMVGFRQKAKMAKLNANLLKIAEMIQQKPRTSGTMVARKHVRDESSVSVKRSTHQSMATTVGQKAKIAKLNANLLRIAEMIKRKLTTGSPAVTKKQLRGPVLANMTRMAQQSTVSAAVHESTMAREKPRLLAQVEHRETSVTKVPATSPGAMIRGSQSVNKRAHGTLITAWAGVKHPPTSSVRLQKQSQTQILSTQGLTRVTASHEGTTIEHQPMRNAGKVNGKHVMRKVVQPQHQEHIAHQQDTGRYSTDSTGDGKTSYRTSVPSDSRLAVADLQLVNNKRARNMVGGRVIEGSAPEVEFLKLEQNSRPIDAVRSGEVSGLQDGDSRNVIAAFHDAHAVVKQGTGLRVPKNEGLTGLDADGEGLTGGNDLKTDVENGSTASKRTTSAKVAGDGEPLHLCDEPRVRSLINGGVERLVTINGKPVFSVVDDLPLSGLFMAAVNSSTGELIRRKHIPPERPSADNTQITDPVVTFIDAVPDESIVLVSGINGASFLINERSASALSRVGSSLAKGHLSPEDGYTLIGCKSVAMELETEDIDESLEKVPFIEERILSHRSVPLGYRAAVRKYATLSENKKKKKTSEDLTDLSLLRTLTITGSVIAWLILTFVVLPCFVLLVTTPLYVCIKVWLNRREERRRKQKGAKKKNYCSPKAQNHRNGFEQPKPQKYLVSNENIKNPQKSLRKDGYEKLENDVEGHAEDAPNDQEVANVSPEELEQVANSNRSNVLNYFRNEPSLLATCRMHAENSEREMVIRGLELGTAQVHSRSSNLNFVKRLLSLRTTRKAGSSTQTCAKTCGDSKTRPNAQIPTCSSPQPSAKTCTKSTTNKGTQSHADSAPSLHPDAEKYSADSTRHMTLRGLGSKGLLDEKKETRPSKFVRSFSPYLTQIAQNFRKEIYHGSKCVEDVVHSGGEDVETCCDDDDRLQLFRLET